MPGDQTHLQPILEAVLGSTRITVDDTTLDAALALLVHMIVAVVPDSHGSSVTMARDGQYTTTAATGRLARELDQVQYNDQSGGPGLTAARSGQVVTLNDATSAAEWPAFVQAAVRRGVRSTLSVPITASGRTVGALNVYSADFAIAEHRHWRRLIEEVAAYGSILAETAATYQELDQLMNDLRQALDFRTQVGQAQGILMAGRQVATDQAFQLMIDMSRRNGLALIEVARAILTDRPLTCPVRSGAAATTDPPPEVAGLPSHPDLPGSLTHGLTAAGISQLELWLRYVGVGGSAAPAELEAYAYGALEPSTMEHNLIAQALNDHFTEHGLNHPVHYAESATKTQSRLER